MTITDAAATTRVSREASGRRTKREWMVPLALIVIAAATRLIGLDQPHTLVFDETYYVKDAYSLSQLGYEAKWGDEPNAAFVAGEPDLTTDGSFVVHPPLGKWIIASGFALFGADNGVGWRFMTALTGIATVLLTYFLARRLTRSVVWAGLAGFFVAIDGVAIVLSRVALLDGILAMFLMLGVLFITIDHDRRRRAVLRRLRDRHRHRHRHHSLSPDSHSPRAPARLGPLVWNRPWVIAAGLAFGAASAVKWSGAYALAGYGLYLVISDGVARYRAGTPRLVLSTIVQGAISFLLLVPVAVGTYIASWAGWLVTSGGYNRDRAGGALAALWDYHRQILNFHNGLTSGHPYSSPAWEWLLLLRPTAMRWEDISGDGSHIETITPIPNPLLWWVGVVAVFYLLYRFAYRPTWPIPIVLVGLAVTYLPWLALPNRTIFQFYTVVMVPFLAIALVMAMQHLAGRSRTPSPSQCAWRVVIGWFVGVATIVSVFFLPLWTGMAISRWFWQLHMWLPSWV